MIIIIEFVTITITNVIIVEIEVDEFMAIKSKDISIFVQAALDFLFN